VVEQIDEIDVAIEVGELVPELLHHAADLQVFGLGDVGNEPGEPERVALSLAERRRLAQARIAQ
jgi:hypothetical protein